MACLLCCACACVVGRKWGRQRESVRHKYRGWAGAFGGRGVCEVDGVVLGRGQKAEARRLCAEAEERGAGASRGELLV